MTRFSTYFDAKHFSPQLYDCLIFCVGKSGRDRVRTSASGEDARRPMTGAERRRDARRADLTPYRRNGGRSRPSSAGGGITRRGMTRSSSANEVDGGAWSFF